MKYLLALLVFIAGCSSEAATHFNPRDAALRLEFEGGRLCSGTAISPDTLLTAKHCVVSALNSVNGARVETVSITPNDGDSAVVRIKGVQFKAWARLGEARVGERVRFWGNPDSMRTPLMYREGYVSVLYDGGVVVVTTVCHGDSGAGVFNDAGEVIGVVAQTSDEYGCTFMRAEPV